MGAKEKMTSLSLIIEVIFLSIPLLAPCAFLLPHLYSSAHIEVVIFSVTTLLGVRLAGAVNSLVLKVFARERKSSALRLCGGAFILLGIASFLILITEMVRRKSPLDSDRTHWQIFLGIIGLQLISRVERLSWISRNGIYLCLFFAEALFVLSSVQKPLSAASFILSASLALLTSTLTSLRLLSSSGIVLTVPFFRRRFELLPFTFTQLTLITPPLILGLGVHLNILPRQVLLLYFALGPAFLLTQKFLRGRISHSSFRLAAICLQVIVFIALCLVLAW
jgi:hypothetical protein